MNQLKYVDYLDSEQAFDGHFKLISMKAKSILHLLIFSLFVMVTGCTSWGLSQRQTQEHYELFKLIPVPKHLQQRIWLDKFTITIKALPASKAKQSMLLQTELTKNGISIAAMSFSGIPLAQAQWSEMTQEISIDTNIAEQLDTKQVMQDLQSVNWPLAEIKNALKQGYSIEERTHKNVKTRQFYFQENGLTKKPIIIIREQGNQINFQQLELGYQLEITRLESTFLK